MQESMLKAALVKFDKFNNKQERRGGAVEVWTYHVMKA